MISPTRAIVLRSIKYGETSLISTHFTELFGVQSFLVQGVRSAKSKTKKAGLLQPAMLLNLEADIKPGRNLQRIREFHPSYIYTTVHEDIIKNSVALFSSELLTRLLPEGAPLPELFYFSHEYFVELDRVGLNNVGNFAIYFIIQCSRYLGYDIRGSYSGDTPYLNLSEGAFTSHPPEAYTSLREEEGKYLSELLKVKSYEELVSIEMNATIRHRLLEWYIQFLQQHTQHLGTIRSLPVLQAILH